jgi:thiol:disulfide interchange protein DsbG
MLKRLFFLSFLPFFCQAEDLPAPVKAIEKQGITIIKPFEAPGGMKGWLGKYQDMGVAIYLTPTASTPFPAICTMKMAIT